MLLAHVWPTDHTARRRAIVSTARIRPIVSTPRKRPIVSTASYVCNVSIIFDCSMLYYLLFWTILGFIFHFYIIFGTNLLTGGPAQNCCFFYIFQCFEETEYQTESKQKKILFGT